MVSCVDAQKGTTDDVISPDLNERPFVHSDLPGDVKPPSSSSPFVHVVSLGTFCFPAQFCKTNKLRGWRGPFDWIHSSAEMVSHCLETQFKDFLDRQHYESHDLGKCGHSLYSQMVGKEFIWMHGNPAHSAAYGDLILSVQRLLDVLSDERRKLFLLVAKGDPGRDSVLHLFQNLCSQSSNFELLVLELEASLVLPENAKIASVLHESLLEANSTLNWYKQSCCANHTGLEYEDSGDNARFEQLLLGQRKFSVDLEWGQSKKDVFDHCMDRTESPYKAPRWLSLLPCMLLGLILLVTLLEIFVGIPF
eukprot:gnl/MRDRNA2_/MRDRNA2_85865_c0_seq1.p1 gnl/MRDRNA2_/MRDRNA2_85865_c0~~gnl/MRDRNA2_/MRDRNA2_85865_c0_seq1.p1  ORF type:complete len:307 (-),score=40.08 gnl/MRDRNA2_/MRDRNA2_85865_c0_seq1:311-1231(-)